MTSARIQRISAPNINATRFEHYSFNIQKADVWANGYLECEVSDPLLSLAYPLDTRVLFERNVTAKTAFSQFWYYQENMELTR